MFNKLAKTDRARVRVKVAVLGRAVEVFDSDAPCCVGDALAPFVDTGGKDLDVRLNGMTTEYDVSLSDGDIISVIPKIRGG